MRHLPPEITRRWLLAAGCTTLAVMPLSACQSTRDAGGGAGASASGTSYLARIRTSNKLPGLSADSTLESAALQQAGYMAGSGRMDHTTGWGKDFAARMKANGIGGASAENIAFGDIDLEELFSRWMNSSGHRRNMLDPRFTRFGLAYVREGNGSNRRYWALVLAS
jgi:uncharacterized protein YkwD